jgi:putative transposase
LPGWIQIVKKRQRILADSLEDQIRPVWHGRQYVGYISPYPGDVYTEVSTEVISGITDRVVPKVKEWQSRPLEDVYCIVWLDAMHFKVREDGKVRHKALYNVLGINK